MVRVPPVRISTVLAPALNKPGALTAVELTTASVPTWMLALSRNEIALASPTAIRAPACTSTVRLSAAGTLPSPTVATHGLGAAVVQTVVVPVVTHSAAASAGASSAKPPSNRLACSSRAMSIDNRLRSIWAIQGAPFRESLPRMRARQVRGNLYARDRIGHRNVSPREIVRARLANVAQARRRPEHGSL